MEKGFKVMDVDSEIAKDSADLRHEYKIPMADSIIAATTLSLNAICLTDDPHFKAIRGIETKWISRV